jgi:XTP/dITP diphosphohydrolase
MSKTLLFVTTNNGKFQEVQRWLAELAPQMQLEQAALDLPEYQSLEVHKVALGKAQEAWQLLKKPLLIDDGGIYLEKYNKFPGTLSKYVLEGIGLEGVFALAQDDPRAYFLNCFTYIEGPCSYQFFEGRCQGHIIKPKHPIKNRSLPFLEILVPEGSTKTLAELKGTEEEKLYNHRYKALKALLEWLEQH